MERLEKEGSGGSGWVRRNLRWLGFSREEKPWRSVIDFQKLTKDLVDSARERGVIEDDPRTVEGLVRVLAASLKDVVIILESHNGRIREVEKSLRLAWYLVFGLSLIAMVFLGMVFGAIFGI